MQLSVVKVKACVITSVYAVVVTHALRGQDVCVISCIGESKQGSPSIAHSCLLAKLLIAPVLPVRSRKHAGLHAGKQLRSHAVSGATYKCRTHADNQRLSVHQARSWAHYAGPWCGVVWCGVTSTSLTAKPSCSGLRAPFQRAACM